MKKILKKLSIAIALGFYCINLTATDLKTDTVYKYLLDSIYTSRWDTTAKVWNNTNKVIFNYNNKDLKTDSIGYSWNATTQKWQIFKDSYDYDSKNRRLLFIHSIWNNDAQIWENYSKYTNAYNTFDKIAETYSYNWSKYQNKWLYSRYSLYTYDSIGGYTGYVDYSGDTSTNNLIKQYWLKFTRDGSGNKLAQNIYYWNQKTKIWDENNRMYWGYDSLNRVISRIGYTFNYNLDSLVLSEKFENTYMQPDSAEDVIYSWNLDSNKWMLSERWNIKYDTFGNESLMAFYLWNKDSAKFLFTGIHEMDYNSFNKMTFNITYSWDSQNKKLVGGSKIYNTYNTAGKLTESGWLWWNSQTDSFRLSYKDVYNYDDNNNLLEHYQIDNQGNGQNRSTYTYDQYNHKTELIDYYWNSKIKDWAQSSRTTYDYDSLGNILELIVFNLNANANGWIPALKMHYYYTKHETIVLDNKYNDNLESTVFPNPAHKSVTILVSKQSEITIYTSDGIIVKQLNTNSNNTISLEGILAGIYFIKIKSKDTIITKQLIVN
jgi:hypothetical protein